MHDFTPFPRFIAALAALALMLVAPTIAEASTFEIGWGATPLTAHGWSASSTGSGCDTRSPGTVIANPGTYPPASGCWWKFQTPGASTVSDLVVWGGTSLASTAFRMRSTSDASTAGTVLAPSTRSLNALEVPARGAHVVAIGLDQVSGADVTLASPDANSVWLDQGIVTLDDPSAPTLQLSQSGSETTAARLTVSFSASDAESSISRATYTLDGGRETATGIRSGCADVFACGSNRQSSFDVATASLASGMHTVAVTVWNGAGMPTTAYLGFMVDHTATHAATVVVEPDPASFSPAFFHGHGPIIVHVDGGSTSTTLSKLYAWGDSAWWTWSTSVAGRFSGPISIPISGSGFRNGVYGMNVVESDSTHTTDGPNSYLDWDAAAPPAVQQVELTPWINAAGAANGAHLQWPTLTGAAPWSGVAGAYLFTSTEAGDPESDARRGAAANVSSVTRGVPGATITDVPASVIHGREKVCLGLVPVSVAGIRQSYASAADIGFVCQRIDEDAPALTLAGDVSTDWRSTPATISASASDIGASGLASLTASVDDGPVTHESNGGFRIADEGIHTVSASATDNAGNTATRTMSVRIDSTPPTVSVSGVPEGWARGAVRITARASDALSGVAALSATVDGALASIDDDGVLVTGDGAHLIEVRGEDQAHNVTTQVIAVRIDTVAPTARVDARAGWSSTPLTVHVALEDVGAAGVAVSGIAERRVRLDGQPAIVDADGGLAVTTDGVHTVEASASDAAGNDSQIATAVVMIDTLAPARAGDLSVDYAARLISLPLIDAGSGVADATLYADGSRLPTSVSRAASGGSVVASAVVPSSQRLAGARITVVSRDAAAPEPNVYDSSSTIGGPITIPAPVESGTKVTVCEDGTTRIAPATCPAGTPAPSSGSGATAPGGGATAPGAGGSGATGASGAGATGATGAAGATGSIGATGATGAGGASAEREAGPGFSIDARAGSIMLARAPRRIAAGTRIVVTGRLVTASATAHQPVVLQQRNAAWPLFARSWSATTDASGAFRFQVAASMSGDLTVRFPGSSTVAPSQTLAARIVVVPRIAARFTSPRTARDAYGIPRFYDVDVSGRFAPARGPKVALLWQARTQRSGRFVSICPDVHVRANGTFRGHCKASPLPLGTQYRLVYRGINHAPYATLRTAPAIAHLAGHGGAMR
jgi:hypothetical protein